MRSPIIFIIILGCFLLSSCSVQKRRYNRGCYISVAKKCVRPAETKYLSGVETEGIPERFAGSTVPQPDEKEIQNEKSVADETSAIENQGAGLKQIAGPVPGEKKIERNISSKLPKKVKHQQPEMNSDLLLLIAAFLYLIGSVLFYEGYVLMLVSNPFGFLLLVAGAVLVTIAVVSNLIVLVRVLRNITKRQWLIGLGFCILLYAFVLFLLFK